MNLLKRITAFFFIVAITGSALAAGLSLGTADFSKASEVRQGPDILISAQLSASGISKMKSLNREAGQNIDLRIGAETRSFKLREPIRSGVLQMGPFSEDAAQRILREINGS